MDDITKCIEELKLFLVERASIGMFPFDNKPLLYAFYEMSNKKSLYINIANVIDFYSLSDKYDKFNHLDGEDVMKFLLEHVTPILLKNNIEQFSVAWAIYKRTTDKYEVYQKTF